MIGRMADFSSQHKAKKHQDEVLMLLAFSVWR